MGWIMEYQQTLRDLGIGEDDLHFPTDSLRGISQMSEKYISRIESTLTTWFTNILEVSPTRELFSALSCTSRQQTVKGLRCFGERIVPVHFCCPYRDACQNANVLARMNAAGPKHENITMQLASRSMRCRLI